MEAIATAGWTESKTLVCPTPFVFESCLGNGELSGRSCCCCWSPHRRTLEDVCETNGEGGDAELVIRPSRQDQENQGSKDAEVVDGSHGSDDVDPLVMVWF